MRLTYPSRARKDASTVVSACSSSSSTACPFTTTLAGESSIIPLTILTSLISSCIQPQRLPPSRTRKKRTLHPSLTSSQLMPSTLVYSIPSHSPCPSLSSTLTIPLGHTPSTLSSSPSFLCHPSLSCRSLSALPSLFSLSVSSNPSAACPTSLIRRIWKSVAFARPGYSVLGASGSGVGRRARGGWVEVERSESRS